MKLSCSKFNGDNRWNNNFIKAQTIKALQNSESETFFHQQNMVKDLPTINILDNVCEGCQFGKTHR